MHKKSIALVCFTFAVLTVIPQRSLAEPPKSKPSPGWTEKMHGLYQTLAELLTNVSSDRRFNDRKLEKTIQNQADKLAKFAHGLSEKTIKRPDMDPTLQLMSEIISERTQEAATALKQKNRDYARSILRAVPSYCIACHTRNSQGVQFRELALEPTEPTLSFLEKGEFFAATRQFDRALMEFEKGITDPNIAASDHWTWKRAVESALAVAVRAKNDPKAAEKIVDAVIASKDSPGYIREDGKLWKKSIVAWIAEKPLPTRNEDSLRGESMRLMSVAKESQQFRMDRSADIPYLRAAAAVHELLQVAKDSRTIADGLFMAGLAYEVLNPLKRDDMHQFYYEACIRKLPHSDISDLCYRRYEENVVLGYTGSAGTSVPGGVRKKLHSLEALARPNQPTMPSEPERRQ